LSALKSIFKIGGGQVHKISGAKRWFLLGLTIPSAWGQLIGPGLKQVTFTQAELFNPVATLLMPAPFGNNLVSLHRGYLMVVFAPDHMLPGGGLRFYDMSNPRSPLIVSTLNTPESQDFVEAHGYGASSSYPGDYAVFQAREGIQFWDLTDIRKPLLLNKMKLPTINGSGYDNGVFSAFWQAPYVYTASSAHGIHIVDAKDPAHPRFVKQLPMNQTGNFRVGLIFAVGNLLVASTVGLDVNAHGYSFFDISDPENPKALSFLNSGPDIYASLVNGNKIYGTGLHGRFYVHDITDPSHVKLDRVTDTISGAHGEYVYIQDNFAMAGFETGIIKVDLKTMKPVGLPMKSMGEAQEGHPVPIGNYLIIGDDHSIGSGVVPHSLLPDVTGPSVNMVNPPENAVNQALTSRVGITLTDLIDLASVNATSFIVREFGGSALPGKYSGQTEILNFFPDEPLKSGTNYEVVIPKGGIKDVSGNPTPEDFVSRFRTAGPTLLMVKSNFRVGVKTKRYRNSLGKVIAPAQKQTKFGVE
jgi:hypothetical protein